MPNANTLPCIKRDNLRFRNRRGGGNFVLFLFTFLVVGGTISVGLSSCIVNAGLILIVAFLKSSIVMCNELVRVKDNFYKMIKALITYQ